MAEPPINGRWSHSLVWSGSEMLVWGGLETSAVTFESTYPHYGAAYDPVTNAWRAIPDAAISGRAYPVSAWSGSELLIWGGWIDEPGGPTYVADGAAYDPAANSWRTLPEAPLRSGDAVGGWLADRLMVVSADGAASYDPSTNRWEALDPAPIRTGWRSAAVAGGRLFVIGFGDGATGDVEGAVFDPTTAKWTVTDVPLGPGDAGVQPFAAGEVVLIPASGKLFDPTAGSWRDVTPCWRAGNGGVWTGRYLIADRAAYEPATDTCFDLPASPPREPPFEGSNGREFAVAIWTGSEYLTWSGGTGADIVWPPNDGAIFRPD
jgi:hypothetical protein